ncbi:hypothetical protein QQ045_010438 [Rhodiola kirilowii]
MWVMKVRGIALLATLLLSSRICWIMKVGGFAVLVTLLLSSRICGVIKLASFVVLVTLLLISRMCSAGSMLFWEDAEPSWELEDSDRGVVVCLECSSCPVNPGCRDCRVDICPQYNPRSSKTGIGQDTGEGNKVSQPSGLARVEVGLDRDLKAAQNSGKVWILEALGSVYRQFND